MQLPTETARDRGGMRADEDALKNGPTMVEKAPLPFGGSLEPRQGMSMIPPLKLMLDGGPDRGRYSSRPADIRAHEAERALRQIHTHHVLRKSHTQTKENNGPARS